MNRFATLALIPLMASPAFAGNIAPAPVEPAPVFTAAPAAPVYSWTGGYVGGQVSYANIDADGLFDDDDDDDSDLINFDSDGDGALYGLRAGYDYDFGAAVLGGLIQYDFGSIDLDDSDLELENVLRVGARLGYNAGQNLFYGAAGWANADTNDAGDADGWFAGLGFERYLTPAVTFGAEALYHEFDDFEDGPDFDGVDSKLTTVGLNLNYRF